MIALSGKTAAIARLIGCAAVVASLGFVGIQLWRHAPWRLAGTHLETLAAAVLGGALLYGVAGLLLSSAWYQLLAGGATAPARCHHAVYGRTQIAKYLPGNVFHLVGRQLAGRRLGHGQARLALASLLEVLLLALIAGALSLPLLWRWLDPGLLWAAALTAPALVLIAVRWGRRHDLACGLVTGAAGGCGRAARRLLAAAALYAAFFLVVAAILWALVRSVSEPGGVSIGLAGSVPVVALAWLVGFATPGSSAGIGVREAMLIAALEGTLGAPAGTLVALALRFVTVAGDVVFFLLGVRLGLPGARPHPITAGDHLA
ncbi:MAG TPA: hypothetical protein VFV80_06415 [Geminicoccaceae bacterium]|nr:hypothetical protein [Geminicoccaceae bacterium]